MNNYLVEQRIEKIIEKRQLLAQTVVPVKRHLEKLQAELGELQGHYDSLPDVISSSHSKSVSDGFSQVKQVLGYNYGLITSLVTRLSRPTLNIGVVGRMGQGKSTFLKSLSGLSDREIPALPGGACTAVRSKIFHHSGETIAKVIFHSQQSFLSEVIAPYYKDLKLGNMPASLQQFAMTLPPNAATGATSETMYEHLKNDYYRNFSHYQHHLQPGAPRAVEISKDQIQSFVTQRRDANGYLVSFNHLAVKEVEIYCQFEQVEVSKLGLVDVPGLGDTRLGDEDLVLKTLGSEVDAVLFLRRPDALRYQWEKADTNLYDIAAKALPNLAERSFMVLNRKSGEGDNTEACERMSQELGNLNVVEALIADCNHQADANRVLTTVLDYLDSHIIELEERYANVCQQSLLRLNQQINDFTRLSRRISESRDVEMAEFNIRFKELYRSLTRGLHSLLDDLSLKRDEDDPTFKKVVDKVLDACERYEVPTEEEIIDRKQSSSSKNSYNVVYEKYVVELRVELSKHFLSLDDGLRASSEYLKIRLANVFKEQGSLGNLSSKSGGEYLKDIYEILEEQENRLNLGFKVIANFNISYSSLILNNIKQSLMEMLGPDTPMSQRLEGIAASEQVMPQENVSASKSEMTTRIVQEELSKLHSEALKRCRSLLTNWTKAPNRIRHYMAIEFVDLVLYDVDMEDEWKSFLWSPDIKPQIWDHFKEIEMLKQSQSLWLASVDKVQQMNQRQALIFLNSSSASR